MILIFGLSLNVGYATFIKNRITEILEGQPSIAYLPYVVLHGICNKSLMHVNEKISIKFTSKNFLGPQFWQ